MKSEPTPQAAPGRPFLNFLRFNRPYRKQYFAGAGLAVFFIAIELTMPLVIRAVVLRFEQGSLTWSFLSACFCLLIVISLSSGFARYGQRMLMIRASRKFEYALRNALFRHVQSLSQDFFHRTKTGDIMARATNDLNYVRMFIGPGVMGTVDLMRVPVTLALMVWLSPHLSLTAMLPLPLVSLLVYFFVMYMHHQSQKVQEQFSTVTSRAQENLAGARVVKAYGVADRELRDFRGESEIYMRESLKLNYVMALAHPLIGLVIGMITLLVLWRGGTLVIEGSLGIEDFSAFIVYLVMLTWPLAQFGWVLTLYQRGAVSMNRITDILVEKPAIADTEATRHEVTGLAGEIRFENVNFGYDGQPVLKDLNFRIPQGTTTAIVGPTGSGKSSVMTLLTREYDAVTGSVSIDGVSTQEIPLSVLRGSIGYVPQDTFLFSSTVAENLSFGCADATRERMDHACEVAQFTETLGELPDGYDTLLGERGINLSGGQKQRLAIARAVVRDPKILILDDALSSVDTHTEEQILQQLASMMASRTSIIISHRVSTVRHADQILVIDEGCIVERGTHPDLVARGGLYSAMYERQLLEDELEEEE